ncbi:MAG: hypothetical protein WC505_06710 [Patescibacteria group bacterium]
MFNLTPEQEAYIVEQYGPELLDQPIQEIIDLLDAEYSYLVSDEQDALSPDVMVKTEMLGGIIATLQKPAPAMPVAAGLAKARIQLKAKLAQISRVASAAAQQRVAAVKPTGVRARTRLARETVAGTPAIKQAQRKEVLLAKVAERRSSLQDEQIADLKLHVSAKLAARERVAAARAVEAALTDASEETQVETPVVETPVQVEASATPRFIKKNGQIFEIDVEATAKLRAAQAPKFIKLAGKLFQRED